MTSYGSVWRIVRDARLSFKKKTLFATEQERPDVARRRNRWKTHQGRLGSGPAGVHRRNMGQDQYGPAARLVAPRQEAAGQGAAGTLATLIFLAALRSDRIDRTDAPLVLDRPINCDSFLAYVEQLLVPTPTTSETQDTLPNRWIKL